MTGFAHAHAHARGRGTRQAGQRAASCAGPDGAASSPLAAPAHALIRLHMTSDFSRIPVQGEARSPTASAGLAARLGSQASAGRPLPGSVRQRLEGGTGDALYDVRVHIGSEADTLARSLGATAFTAGRDIFFRSGRYDPDSAAGYRLLAHEVTHATQRLASTRLGTGSRRLTVTDPAGADEHMAEAGADLLMRSLDRAAAGSGSATEAPFRIAHGTQPDHGDLVIARTPAKDMVNAHTSLMNLDEEGLGRDLLARARAGDLAIAQQVLDEVGSTDRDDVSVAFMAAATAADVASLANSAEGRDLLDRMYDELTSGSVGADERKQADRILSAKSRRIAPADFQAGVEKAKIFPFRLPGVTVFNAAPISAERRKGGRIWVKQNVNSVLGNSEFRAETQTLPTTLFTSGIELPEDEIVGVKMYDLGGVVQYRPALFLVELANATDMKELSIVGEITMLGLTLGSGALAGEGTTVTARILLAADRVAFAAGTITSIIGDHRGWILQRFGDKGQTLLHYVNIVNSVVAVYGGVRALVGMGQLINSAAKAIAEWRSAAKAVESELSSDQQQVVRQISQQTDDLLRDVETARGQQATAGTGPGAAGTEVPEPRSAAKPTEPAQPSRPGQQSEAPPASVGAMRRYEYEWNPKHPQWTAEGPTGVRASKAPKNGQDALDLSVQVKDTSPRRVGVDYEAGEFVVFDEHGPGKFHGHVRTWDELENVQQNALIKAGLTDRRGKISR